MAKIKKNKVLIIEDESDMVKILNKRFSQNEFDVLVSSEGSQGVSIAQNNKPDIIVLDLMLPTGDGLEVLESLNGLPETKDIPVIVVTGNKDERYKKQVIDKGVAAYLEKPYSFETLMDIINNIFKNKKGI
ncbi:MAG: response regulator [Candidatus Omnitrophica bacterium]|nr:response regulator [Candidatus Omnitrophota bacterium]